MSAIFSQMDGLLFVHRLVAWKVKVGLDEYFDFVNLVTDNLEIV